MGVAMARDLLPPSAFFLFTIPAKAGRLITPSCFRCHCRSYSSGGKLIMRAILEHGVRQLESLKKKRIDEEKEKRDDEEKEKEKAKDNMDSTKRPPFVGQALQKSMPSIGSPAKLPVNAWKVREGWGCVKRCGACCYLRKGPEYPPVEEVFPDPAEAALYKSMIGKDGWCKHFNKFSRVCTIYKERPRFCRVEPEILDDLFGIPEHKVDKTACRLCRDSISNVYGCKSLEMKNFEQLIASLRHK